MRHGRLSGPARPSIVRLENSDLPIERFGALEELDVLHGFVRRIQGIALSNDKAAVLASLDEALKDRVLASMLPSWFFSRKPEED